MILLLAYLYVHYLIFLSMAYADNCYPYAYKLMKHEYIWKLANNVQTSINCRL